MELQKIPKKEQKQRCYEVLKEVGLLEYAKKYPRELSGGMKQRISFARTLLAGAKMLLLDEPFSGLDPINSGLLKDVIIELINRGKYIIMSSHQMMSIEEFCKDVVILNKGKTVLQGNLKEIKETYPANRVEIDVNQDITKYIEEFNLEIENVTNNNYVIKITDEEKAHNLLNKLVSNDIRVDKFEIKKPTLNDIFIEKVGE